MNKYIETDRSIFSKAKRWMIGKLPRKFHCFGLGSQKTGTTTLARMFEKNYRSNHEADPRQTTQLMVDYINGNIGEEEVKEIILKRDKLLNLEMESAHHLVYVSDILVEIFPEANYIITIREPYGLLESRLNWNITPTKPAWRNFNKYFFGNNHTGYAKEEEILREHNLHSLDAYLAQYADHYKRILENIPEQKRLFIKTSELNEAPKKISSFLDIEESSLVLAHSKKNKKKAKILSQMDQGFVKGKIWEHCNELIKTFFPESISKYKNY